MLTNELKENIKIKEGIITSNDSQNSDLNNNNIQNDFEKVDIYYKKIQNRYLININQNKKCILKTVNLFQMKMKIFIR